MPDLASNASNNHSAPVGQSRAHKSAPKHDVLDLQPEHLSQTRSQISALVAEIAAAAKQWTDRSAFMQLALDRTREAMGANAASLWRRNASGRWNAATSHVLPSELVTVPALANDNDEQVDTLESIKRRLQAADKIATAQELLLDEKSTTASDAHALVLECIDKESHPVLVPPRNVATRGDRPANPSEFCLVNAPVMDPDGDRMWLQVVQPAAGGPATHRGYLRFVVQISELIAEFLQTSRLRDLQEQRNFYSAANQIFMDISELRRTEINAEKRLSEASIIARNLAECLDADEAFLVVLSTTNRTLKIAPSANGMEIVPHSEAAAELRQAITEASAIDNAYRPVIVDETSSANEFHDVRTCLAAHTLAWQPLIGDRERQPRHIIGLISAWFRDPQSPAAKIEQKLQSAASVARLAIAWTDDSLVRPSYNAIQSARNPRHRWRRLIWNAPVRTCVLLTALTIACCIPVPMHIAATGKLIPSRSHAVYAPIDGVIRQVPIQYAQVVKQGQILLEMSSISLESELESLLSERSEAQQRIQDLESQMLRTRDLPASQKILLETELKAQQVTERSLGQRISLLRKQMEQLSVRSQIDGVIGTWKVDSLLNNRPVQAGQPLLAVYDPESSWEFEIAVQESDAGALRDAITNSENSLKADVRLDSHPLQLVKISLQLNEQEWVLHQTKDGQSVVPIRLSVDAKRLPQITPGATATVRLPVGHSPVIWAISRNFVLDLWARVRLWI